MRIRSVDDLGAVARDRRRELGMSQAALAERADVTRQWVVRFEQGASDVSFSRAVAVLRALNLDLRVDPAEARGANGHRLSVDHFRIPKIEVPRIDLSGLDWQAVSQRLAATKVDFSDLVAGLRALSAPTAYSSAAIEADDEPLSDA